MACSDYDMAVLTINDMVYNDFIRNLSVSVRKFVCICNVNRCIFVVGLSQAGDLAKFSENG